MIIMPVFRHLTTDGLIADGSNDNAAIDGSSVAVPFFTGPLKDKWSIHRMIVIIEDNAVITADNYGGLSALTNGITVKVTESGATGPVIVDLLDGSPIKNHVGWAAHTFDMQDQTFGSGNNFVAVRWTFSHGGRPLILDSFRNEKLVVTINDNLSTLVSHQFQIQGHEMMQESDHLVTWGTS